MDDWKKNFINHISNSNAFSPTTYIEPKDFKYKGKSIIHIHVNPSSEVHSYNGVTYDRNGDADVKVTATDKKTLMYIRKQNIYTERKVFPYVDITDLRLDMLPRIRQMAVNMNNGKHKWKDMDDAELLKSAGLYSIDHQTNERGYNLAAVMLLGRDEVIRDVTPAYETDAIVRIDNVDRYDDRLIVDTNLVDSYDLLMEFTAKHLPDPFYLEGPTRISLRNILCREMISNLLIHREMTSAYPAKFVIEAERMYTQNANKATGLVEITPDNYEPYPKNPIIANFFRTIGHADRLGSGVRNLFKYAQHYRHSRPEMLELDIFRTTVYYDSLRKAVENQYVNQYVNPENPSVNGENPHVKGETQFVTGENQHVNDENPPVNDVNPPLNLPINSENPPENLPVNGENGYGNGENGYVNSKIRLSKLDCEILKELSNNPKSTHSSLSQSLEKGRETIRVHIKKLAEARIISRLGADKNGSWVVNISLDQINLQ